MSEIEANGVRLHYEMAGAGPPLVFVHGMCGRGAVWADQVERLSGELTCVTYDRRGHGSSTDTDEPTPASLAIASGADVKVVQQMLGHNSATMTLDLSGHLLPVRLDVVAGTFAGYTRDGQDTRRSSTAGQSERDAVGNDARGH